VCVNGARLVSADTLNTTCAPPCHGWVLVRTRACSFLRGTDVQGKNKIRYVVCVVRACALVCLLNWKRQPVDDGWHPTGCRAPRCCLLRAAAVVSCVMTRAVIDRDWYRRRRSYLVVVPKSRRAVFNGPGPHEPECVPFLATCHNHRASQQASSMPAAHAACGALCVDYPPLTTRRRDIHCERRTHTFPHCA
jgi:hypothetical protein